VSLATIVVGVIATMAALTGFFGWLWKKAQRDSKQTAAIQQNTEATKGLSASFKTYTDKADGHLLDHEKRVTVLEAAMQSLIVRMNDFISSMSHKQ